MPHSGAQGGADPIWYVCCVPGSHTLVYVGCRRGHVACDKGQLTATTKLMSGYVASEALRRDLVEARQKLMEAKEKEEDPAKKANIDEDAPGNLDQIFLGFSVKMSPIV